ncbi:hypothetical protein GYMLUDRAFT_247607 [Collybiopsis luxurians FD-317 M1]|uniref:Unplaced genomic scaffold GYMLUscaffold_47, whole genome shotgun sequence n=1 Tax=Collybiopsis luxurians FD-317 M1 TaxID=944289 RepID=A0A0D0B163_9AGAR|nr:hypothetical protein GYMLUDRAFT_247607 [Collybiopsis luxurians FD-317 M1]
MSISQNSVTAPRFPEAKQLVGEGNWQEYKREVVLAVQSRSLMGYLDGTIAKPLPTTSASPGSYGGTIYPAIAATPFYSAIPHFEEWITCDTITTSIIVTNIIDLLVSKYKKCNEQKIHIVDMALRKEVYDPEVSMEDHEMKMRNLLKKLHNASGTCSNSQFPLIVIASMPKEWKLDLYLDKKGEVEEEERETKKIKALLAKNPMAFALVMQSTTADTVEVNVVDTNLEPSELYLLAAEADNADGGKVLLF